MIESIFVAQDVLSKDDCKLIIEQAPKAEDYYVAKNVQMAHEDNAIERKDKQFDGNIVINSFNDWKQQSQKLTHILEEALKAYAERFTIIKDYHLKDGVHFTEFKIQQTLPGGGFHKWHFEDFSMRDRFLVWTIFLNDVEQGGETEFLYHSVRVPARQGSMCIFPSDFTHTHRGNPPLSGEKWIMTGWYKYNWYQYVTPQLRYGHRP